MSSPKSVVHQSERELTMSRVFRAPRELLWEVFTSPEHLARWWGPKGCATTIYEMDLSPGGVWYYGIRAPNGDEHQVRAIYEEVIRPERIVYSQTFVNTGDKNKTALARAGRVTVTFEENNGHTTLTSHVSFQSAKDFDSLKAIGTIRGTELTWDRLEEYLLTSVKGDRP